MKATRWEDPVVAEIRGEKDRLAKKFNYDLAAVLKDAQKREKRHGARVVSFAMPGKRTKI